MGLGKPSRRRATNQPGIQQWLALPAERHAAEAKTPQISQIVHETEAISPGGQHRNVTLERVSTGGTRHQAGFKRAVSGALSGAERMQKARMKRSLFPEEQAAARDADAARKRDERAPADGPTPEHHFCSKCKRWYWVPTGKKAYIVRDRRVWPSDRLQWWLPDTTPDNGWSSDDDETSHWEDDGQRLVCVECRKWKVPELPGESDDEDDIVFINDQLARKGTGGI